MANKTDLDAAIASFATDVASLLTLVASLITENGNETNRLLAKIAAAAPDLQSSIDALKKIQSDVVAVVPSVTSQIAQDQVEGI